MAKKKGRPTWFKMFLAQKAAIDEMPNEVVGSALKAAMSYFETGEIPEIDLATRGLFATMRESINEAYADFEEASIRNRNNVNCRYNKDGSATTGTTGSNLVQGATREAEAEAEAEVDNKVNKEIQGASSEAWQPPGNHLATNLTAEEQSRYNMMIRSRIEPEKAMLFIERLRQGGTGNAV